MSARSSSGTALVIEHERPTPPGLIADWLELRGLSGEILAIDDGRRPREAITDYEMVFSLGSEFAAFDDDIPWLAQELELLDAALAARVPVFGVCFGGQLLARVLGGDVWRSSVEEIGWLDVRSTAPEFVGEGPWFQWHFDTFTVPAVATTIADSPAGPQAFTYANSLGVQFHPEVTPEIMERWVGVYRHELDHNGVDPEALLERTHLKAADARRLSFQLFDRFHEHATAVAEAR